MEKEILNWKDVVIICVGMICITIFGIVFINKIL
jgi:uncharacterized membrane protein YfcA